MQWGGMPQKRLACLQGTLDFLGFDGFAVENVTFPHQKSMDVLESQGWVGFLAEGFSWTGLHCKSDPSPE
eukprot:4083276-Pyramimonas_sp.AAC.1